jgi:hypothetical protein
LFIVNYYEDMYVLSISVAERGEERDGALDPVRAERLRVLAVDAAAHVERRELDVQDEVGRVPRRGEGARSGERLVDGADVYA